MEEGEQSTKALKAEEKAVYIGNFMSCHTGMFDDCVVCTCMHGAGCGG